MQKVTASEKCRLHEAFWHYSILAGMATLGLANRRLQPLGHSSMSADMPDTGASRKRQIQITRGRLEAPMLSAYASRTADIPYRAIRCVFHGSGS